MIWSHLCLRYKYLKTSVKRALIRRRLNKLPVIIGGCGRSGTTLLLSLLSAHPRIFAIERETYILCPTAYDEYVNLNATINLAKIYTILIKYEIPKQKRRFCEKTPKNILFIGQILDIFHNNVRFIHLVRDGRDVITSRHPKLPYSYWVEKERWITDVAAGLKYEDRPQVLTLKYEDLILNFEDTLHNICNFLNEDFHEHLLSWHKYATVRKGPWFHGVKKLHSGSIGRWKKPEHKAVVDDFMNDTRAVDLLKHLDYEC